MPGGDVSALLVGTYGISTGRRVHDPELKHDTVPYEIRHSDWCGQET